MNKRPKPRVVILDLTKLSRSNGVKKMNFVPHIPSENDRVIQTTYALKEGFTFSLTNRPDNQEIKLNTGDKSYRIDREGKVFKADFLNSDRTYTGVDGSTVYQIGSKSPEQEIGYLYPYGNQGHVEIGKPIEFGISTDGKGEEIVSSGNLPVKEVYITEIQPN